MRFALFLVIVSPIFASLPRTIDCVSQAEAQHLANAYVAALGAKVAVKGNESLSMAPFIGPCAIFLYVEKYAELERGAIVIRRDADMAVCHDVIAKVGDEWQMKGRANSVPDKMPLTAKNYVGTVVMILRYPKP